MAKIQATSRLSPTGGSRRDINASKPVYHSSAFPWSAVETSGAVHVGDVDQARDMFAHSGGKPSVNPIILQKGGVGDPAAEQGVTRRQFTPPPSVPNNGLNELNFQPGAGFHDEDLSDAQANTAHAIHSREADYARGRSIDQSSHSISGASSDSATGRAVQALRENKVLRYSNTIEGNGRGVSYVVPNPDLNLRLFGEDPTPIAGKKYHQPTLPGVDLAAVRNPGPFDDGFKSNPDHEYDGDTHKPNMSRTRKRRMQPIKATIAAPSSGETATPGQGSLL